VIIPVLLVNINQLSVQLVNQTFSISKMNAEKLQNVHRVLLPIQLQVNVMYALVHVKHVLQPPMQPVLLVDPILLSYLEDNVFKLVLMDL
jgi:hypothetical protein